MHETHKALKRIGKEEMKSVLGIQTSLLKAMQKFMASKGFVQLMPIITSPLTDPLGPDHGSSIIKSGEIEYYGQKLMLTQSMIFHKQLAISGGLGRIFVFSPNVRLEHKKKRLTGKHLFEFTQMDFEMSGAGMGDVFGLVEGMVMHSMRVVLKERKKELDTLGRELGVPKGSFKRYTTHYLEQRYGKEWELPASMDHKEPFWAICHEREFYDREDPDEPGHFRNYDLIWPEGFGEALSGGEREFEHDRIKRRIDEVRLAGVPIKKERLKHYMFLAKKGLLLPSAGGGIGVERFLRFVTGAEHIREVQPFARVPGERVIF